MDLNFYSDLSDGTGQPGDPEFLDPQAFNGFDAVQKVSADLSRNYRTRSIRVFFLSREDSDLFLMVF
ncbi:TOX high mobility group box family member 4 isoform X1 [Labeo rohita]|uniref:TOX high mobility group box family member 4 isoform X1 n=1 Tax=Labeo rohita TaxID=84645 RepID=A0A498NVG7_LABRO|nr:TOX high mobility group box family member 4 isoform X1 [Labeo rohita]